MCQKVCPLMKTECKKKSCEWYVTIATSYPDGIHRIDQCIIEALAQWLSKQDDM